MDNDLGAVNLFSFFYAAGCSREIFTALTNTVGWLEYDLVPFAEENHVEPPY